MKPILFNTTMVKAILEGRKVVTRRSINVNNELDFIGFVTYSTQKEHEGEGAFGKGSFKDIVNAKIQEYKKPPYQVGDILYVRETWCDTNKDLVKNSKLDIGGCQFIFKVDDNGKKQPLVEMDVKRWRPSIHMPRIAARIFLKVTDIRAERLQDMEEQDFFKEGIREFTKDGIVKKYDVEPFMHKWSDMPRSIDLAFKHLWDSTVQKGKFTNLWDNNPWVWVIEFKKL